MQVWVEGYAATGNSGEARLVGEVDATDLNEACRILNETTDVFDYYGEKILKHGDPPSFWGCRIFDNEEDARKGFG